ncbi:hypothetical protein ACTVZO_43345 [Streptomyces sp. IBSNAI002]|uniref:hypothetical protein n=1 Tax=Streptomyces sp. IBSNAI002 TaxID=3457500 RepID=UPI003FCF3679
MRTAFKSLTTLAAAVAAIGVLGLQSAQAEPSHQTFTATGANPKAALAAARQQMADSVAHGTFSTCTETDSTSSWVKVPGRPANGTATVHAYCQ